MFQVKVTIEVLNDQGLPVDYRGYVTQGDYEGAKRPIRASQVVAPVVSMEEGHRKLQALFHTIHHIKDFAQ